VTRSVVFLLSVYHKGSMCLRDDRGLWFKRLCRGRRGLGVVCELESCWVLLECSEKHVMGGDLLERFEATEERSITNSVWEHD
jgi:hypothetical protein